MVDFLQQRLDRLRTREAVGLITGTEVQLVKINLDAAKDDLNLAMQEIDILKKLK
jgi:outer membrane protein TolC